jgi:folate-dependent phosphoribosylglycinamide formyltransferase PurN
VINIHPSLLPRFGGKGMYGSRVHQAVIDSGATVSGCSVHFVDDQFDNGPVILQRSCEVHPDDTAVSLAARVFEQEKRALPEAIHLFATGQLKDAAARMRPNTGLK